MQKTRLGIDVGLTGCIVCLVACFAGYIGLILIGGYVLLFESNEWLKKLTIKAIVLKLGLSLLTGLLNLVPNLISFVNHIFNVFGSYVSLNVVNSIIGVFTSAIVIVEVVVFVIMAVKALRQGALHIGFIDQFIHQHTENNM